MEALHAEVLRRIARRFEEGPVRAYLVGGVVRDLLLDRPSRDLDLLLEAPESEQQGALGALAREAGMNPVPFDRRAPVTYRVVVSGVIVDASFCPPGSLARALERRDFTINAMALPLPHRAAAGGKIVQLADTPALVRSRLADPLGGLAHLSRRLIAPAGPEALDDDPLRMLRAIRLEATLEGFHLDEALAAEIKLHAQRIREPAAERISLEMEMILESPHPAAALRRMDEMGLLSRVLPELGPLRGLAQPPRHHDHDVLEHTLRAVEAADFLSGGSPEAGLAQANGEAALALKWAALLHDTGKAATATVGEDGTPHFYGHESVSAEMAAETLRRLRVPSRIARIVSALISMHLRLGALAASGAGDRPIRRLVRDAGETLPLLAALALADRRASGGSDPETRDKALLAVVRRALELREEVAELSRAAPLLRGEEVMSLMGLAPGPRVGSILRWLDRLRAEGRISTKQQAEALLKDLPPSRIED